MTDIDLTATTLHESKQHSQSTTLNSAFNYEAELAALDDLADWLDSKFEIPGTGIRFGLDPILGLLPGIGDTLSAIPAGHIILTGQRLGASPAIILRMLGNVAIDAMVGFVPVLGDLLDVSFKANRRNVALLREYFNVPAKPRTTI